MTAANPNLLGCKTSQNLQRLHQGLIALHLIGKVKSWILNTENVLKSILYPPFGQGVGTTQVETTVQHHEKHMQNRRMKNLTGKEAPVSSSCSN